MKKRCFFRFLFFFFCYLSSVAPCNHICTSTQEELSLHEIEELKQLFRYLFAETEFGYTLLGNKPMSFCFPPTQSIYISSKDKFFKIFKSDRINVSNALAVLKKIKVNNKYIFIIKKKRDGTPDCVFFINKEKWMQTFNENIDAFRKVYGHKINAELFLKSLQTKNHFIAELFEQHLLLGILLGYGRHNAELFQRRHPLFGRKKIPYSIYPKPSAPFLTIEEELCFFKKKLKLIHSNQCGLLRVNRVNFAADLESSETIQLHKHYSAIHQKLTQLFSTENWFETLLEQLCSD